MVGALGSPWEVTLHGESQMVWLPHEGGLVGGGLLGQINMQQDIQLESSRLSREHSGAMRQTLRAIGSVHQDSNGGAQKEKGPQGLKIFRFPR